jgi:hypothetical protein
MTASSVLVTAGFSPTAAIRRAAGASMILRPPPVCRRFRRPALTLLEVMVALTIFLLAMIVFGEMVIHNGDVARDVTRQNLAARLCRSKLSEVIAGVTPLSSEGDTPFDEEPNYLWSLDAEQGAVNGLWNVTVRVHYQGDGTPIETALTQMVLDPSIVGSTQDFQPIQSSSSSSSSSSSGTTGTAATATPPAAAAGGATRPAGGSTAPSSGGGIAPTTPTRPAGGGTTPATPPKAPSGPTKTPATTPTGPPKGN